MSTIKTFLITTVLVCLVGFVTLDIRGVRDFDDTFSRIRAKLKPAAIDVGSKIGERGKSLVSRIKGKKGGKEEESQLDLPIEYVKKVKKELGRKEALRLIGHPPTKYGSNWYFLEPKFLSPDLIQVSYEDGHKRGKMILRIVANKGGKIKFQVVWDSLNR